MGQLSYNISPSHRPGSAKVMGTPQYITHLIPSQARFSKGDGHTTVYHTSHPLKGQVQQRWWAHHSVSHISPPHRPGSAKVMGTPQYITHLTPSQARFNKGDGHTTVYHATSLPLTGQVQQTKVISTPQYIMQRLTLSQARFNKGDGHTTVYHATSHPLTGQVQQTKVMGTPQYIMQCLTLSQARFSRQRRWAHNSISCNVSPSHRPGSEDKGNRNTEVYHAVSHLLIGQFRKQKRQAHWGVSCTIGGNTEIMKYLTFSLARYTRQKLIEIPRYVTMSHFLSGQVQKTKRLWEYRGAMQCLTFSRAKCRRQKVMGIQRYHGRNVSPFHWPCAEDEGWWEYRGTTQCLTFSLARCRRQVMGIQRYHTMPHLHIGQVQKANKAKGDGNIEVSHNASPSHWPGAEGK